MLIEISNINFRNLDLTSPKLLINLLLIFDAQSSLMINFLKKELVKGEASKTFRWLRLYVSLRGILVLWS
jgi:hypothetical protein